MLKIYLVQPLTGFPACRSVAYRHGLNLILAHHALHGSSGLHALAAGRMRIDDFMMHKIALGVKTRSLASIGKAWVDSHDALLSKRCCQEQLAQVLCKDNDCLLIGLLLALSCKLSLDTGFQQALECIIDGLAYQSLALAKAMNIMTFQFGDASFFICRYADTQETCRLSTTHGQQTMGRTTFQWFREVEIIGEALGIFLVFLLCHHL